MNIHNIDSALAEIRIGERIIRLYVPDEAIVRRHYEAAVKRDPKAAFPFWSRLWPAAIGLCHFLADRPSLYQDKAVLELAAGLGLPSMYCAPLAGTVLCSDYIGSAVRLAALSAQENQFSNLTCHQLDWHCVPEDIRADLVLLSDVNYDPTAVAQIKAICERFLQAGSRIILSTPVRIVASEFVTWLHQVCKEYRQIEVEATPIHIFLL